MTHETLEEGWEETIQYGHMLELGIFLPEYKGKNYATHQRTVRISRATPIDWTEE